jgi:endonuclease/exonuclease/phosphatase (EEP) superfamily protein YafD
VKLPGFELLERRLAGVLRVWLIVGILLRVTQLRDRFDGLAFVFYTTPWPALALGFVGMTIHSRRTGRGHATRRYVLFTGVALVTWIATSWYSAGPPGRGPDLRLVHWNVARPETRLPRIAAWLRARDADIICLAEAQPRDMSSIDLWRAEFPGYRVQEAPGSMLCLVRGEVLSTEPGALADGSFFARHRLKVRGRTVEVLQVDVRATPWRSRREPLQRLVQIIQAQPGARLIVAGDFNTPRESVLLRPLREQFTHCFEAAGTGLAETWPVPLVALSLDQVWAGRGWRVLGCKQPLTWMSDHRPVEVTLAAE